MSMSEGIIEGKSAVSKYKYLLEDKREQYGKWYMFSIEPWCHIYGVGTVSGGESTRWTNDANEALQWDNKEDAEQFKSDFYNMDGFEITEHEFVGPKKCNCKENECCSKC